MIRKTLGKKLISAVKEALDHKESGKIVRPKINITAIRKKSDLQKSLSNW